VDSNTTFMSRVYHADTDTTTITAPYVINATSGIQVVGEDGYWFQLLNPLNLGDTLTPTFDVKGNATGRVFVGFTTTWRVTYTEPCMFRPTADGREVVLNGLNWALSVRASFKNSGSVRLEIGNPEVQTYESGPLTADRDQFGVYAGADFVAEEIIGGLSEDVTVSFVTDGPYPCNLEAIEWSIEFTPRGKTAVS
jgi:hypothetical protein